MKLEIKISDSNRPDRYSKTETELDDSKTTSWPELIKTLWFLIRSMKNAVEGRVFHASSFLALLSIPDQFEMPNDMIKRLQESNDAYKKSYEMIADELRASNNNANDQIKQLYKDKSYLADQLTKARQQIKTANKVVVELRTEIDQLLSSTPKAKDDEIARLNGRINEMYQITDLLIVDRDKARLLSSDLEKVYVKLQQEYVEAERRYDFYKCLCSEAQGRADEYNKQRGEMQLERDDLKAKVAELSDLLYKAEQDAAEMHVKLERAKRDYATLAKSSVTNDVLNENNRLANQLTRAHAEISRLGGYVSTLQDNLSHSDRQRGVILDKYDVLLLEVRELAAKAR